MTQAEQIELAATERSVTGKQVKRLRREGWTPAVMYGHGFDAVPLQFETRSLTRLLTDVGGSQLIRVRIKGKQQPEMALLRDVQRDPIRQTILHVDLYRVKMTERITAEVPIEIVGESPIIESRMGILIQGVSSIEVSCLPGDLVDAIEVDISGLTEVDQAIHVCDLAIPAWMETLTEPDEMIVRIVPLEEAPVSEEEEVGEEGLIAETAEVEVIREASREES